MNFAKLFKVTLVILFFQIAAQAAEVIDLGKVKVDGAARGPEIQMVGDDPIAQKALRKAIIDEISKTEPALLQELEAYGRKGVTK